MRKMKVIFMTILLSLLAFCVNSYAQYMDNSREETITVGGASQVEEMDISEPLPASRENPDEESGIGTLEGTIKAVDQDQLTFKMSYPITFEFEVLNFTILPMTEIIKNMADAEFMDMEAGDRAIVDYIDDSSDPLKAVRITLVGKYED